MKRCAMTLVILACGWLPSAMAETYEAPLDTRKDAEVRFAAPPKAQDAGDTVKISFAASAPTDAEVAVVDASDKVVRHLAAGILGPNAPEPFQKGSLAQEVLWDRRDDAGKPVGGAFKVRVRLGVRARLEKFLGWSGNSPQRWVKGLAVGRRGELYVLLGGDSGWHTLMAGEVRVLSKEGKYLRTIMPYPGNTPAERTKAIGQLQASAGLVPIVYCAHNGALHPLTTGVPKQDLRVGPNGHLLFASGIGNKLTQGPPRHLLALHPEGGAPPETGFLGPLIRAQMNWMGGMGEGGGGGEFNSGLAASPDGEWIYLVRNARYRHGGDHAVYRIKWTDKDLGQPFLGDAKPGNDEAHFNAPAGLDTDSRGNLYVCDRGNNRVVVFAPDGKRLGQVAVEAPEQVGLHLPTGSFYVLSRKMLPNGRPDPNTVLRKFSPWGATETKELASLALKTIDLMAVDSSAEPPCLWVATTSGWNRPHEIRRVVERDDRLEIKAPVNGDAGLERPCELVADPARNRLLVREHDRVLLRREWCAVDLNTGKQTVLWPDDRPGPVLALDRDGNVYLGSDYTKNGILRFDPAGKPLPFAATGSHQAKWDEPKANPHWCRGIAVGLDGTIYVLRNTGRHQRGQLDAYSPDGTLKRADIVKGLDRGSNGLGVDAAGNIYLGINVKRKDQPYPPELAGQIPDHYWWFWWPKPHPWSQGRLRDPKSPWWWPAYNPYLFHWGSIVKFGPGGGAIYGLREAAGDRASADPMSLAENAPAGAMALTTGSLMQEVRIAGARWQHHGFGIVADSLMGPTHGDPGCLCQMSGFAVDPYGRTYYPNPFLFRVEALDAAGNPMLTAGGYGNADSQGPGSKIPRPEIAFAWPTHVACAEDRLYVSDPINHRIVAVRLEHAAEGSAPIPQALAGARRSEKASGGRSSLLGERTRRQ